MKAILFILPLAGFAIATSAGEPVKVEAPNNSTTLSVTKESRADAKVEMQEPTEKVASEKQNQRIDRAIEKSRKKQTSFGRTFMTSLNPLAPVDSKPDSRWLSRAAWGTTAEKAAANLTPVEVRHESHLGVVICSR